MCLPRALSALVALVAVTTAAACTSDRGQLTAPPLVGAESSSPPEPRDDGAIRTVGIIGDSITVGSERALVDAVEDLGLDVVSVDAASGRRLVEPGGVGSGVEAAARVAAYQPDVWVVALGTNDVANLGSVEEYAVAIDSVLREVPAGAPVVWVDVYVASADDASADFNRVLRRRLDDRGAATVVDWAERADDEGILRDGVHPSEPGGEVFADLVASSVATWLE